MKYVTYNIALCLLRRSERHEWPFATGDILTASRRFRGIANVARECRWVMKKVLIATALMVIAPAAMSQDAHKSTSISEMTVFKTEELKSVPNPMFPKGAVTVRLLGDPSKAEFLILRTIFPANYHVPPHTHPVLETVTIISGRMKNAMGDKFDPQKGEILKAGAMFVLPAGHTHYVWTNDEEVIVQVAGVGPFGINYVNPADDPRKK